MFLLESTIFAAHLSKPVLVSQPIHCFSISPTPVTLPPEVVIAAVCVQATHHPGKGNAGDRECQQGQEPVSGQYDYLLTGFEKKQYFFRITITDPRQDEPYVFREGTVDISYK